MIKINRPECPNPEPLLNKSNYKHPINKEVLDRASHGKCMYCESKITSIYYGDIEHIKPKSLYPELEFNWGNLGFVCAKCNGAKKEKFDENTPYINPYEEDPESYFIALGTWLRQKKGNERGELTILDIKLNRPELIEKRKERQDAIHSFIDRWSRTQSNRLKRMAKIAILEEYEPDKEFSFFVKTWIDQHDL